MIKTCENCHKEWNAARSSQKFCGVDCQHQFRSKSNRETRVCSSEQCVQEFSRKKSDPAKYCSRSCAAKVNNSLVPKRRLEGKCRECEMPISTAKTYCPAHSPQSRLFDIKGFYSCRNCHQVRPVSKFSRTPNGNVSGFCIECQDRKSLEAKERFRNRTAEEIDAFRDLNRPGGVKRCRTCRSEKKFDLFYSDCTARDGLSHRCKECFDEKGRAFREGTVNRLISLYGDTCLFPGCKETSGLHIDHVIPLALNGPDEFDNYQLLCQYHNCSKGATHVDYRPKV